MVASSIQDRTRLKRARATSALMGACFSLMACGATPTLSEAAQRGQRAFEAHCGACHAVGEADSGGGGPALDGLLGRRAADTDFSYSPAMQASGVVWTRATLDAFLTEPRAFIPNNQMAFYGMPDAATRSDIIEFLAASSGD